MIKRMFIFYNNQGKSSPSFAARIGKKTMALHTKDISRPDDAICESTWLRPKSISEIIVEKCSEMPMPAIQSISTDKGIISITVVDTNGKVLRKG